MTSKLESFTDVLGDPDVICDSQTINLYSQPLSLSSVEELESNSLDNQSRFESHSKRKRPDKRTGEYGEFRSIDEIDVKYRNIFSYQFFNLVQSRVIEDALYSDKSMVVCAPTGSGKTVVFEMAIVRLLMELEDRNENLDFKIIYIAPVKALCTERLTEWYSKFTKLGLLCIEVTGDTDVDFSHLKPYRIIITTPEKWDVLTRRWRDHRQLVEVIKLFLIDEVHILNDETRGPVLEAVVSRMKTIETSVQSTHRIEQLQQQYQGTHQLTTNAPPSIRFVAVSATVSNPEDVAAWLGTAEKPAVYYKFGDECRPVKLKRVVEGYHCAEGTSIFKFDLVLNYKLWPIIQKYHNGKPTLIFCNTRKSVAMTAETLSREITISFNDEQKARLTALASTIKNKKLQMLVLSGVGCHHAGLLYEERGNIERAFRNRDLPILITTTTLAMGVNLPAHLVIVKNTQQYVGGAYQEYSISTVLQMVGRAGRPQYDTEATAVIMTRMADKPRYQALVGGSEPLQSYLHKRLPENLNSEAALGTVGDVAQCVQWLRSTFLSVRAAKDPKRYLGLPQTAPHHQISKKIEELCVKAMNGLASSGLITMDEACCIESTEAGRLMSIFYLDLETMKHIMKIGGTASLEQLLQTVCESHELSDMHLRIDERRCLNALNRNNAASTIRFPMKGKITTRQMKLNCVIQAILGCLPIPDPSLNQEATKIMRVADRVCKCLVAYMTRPAEVYQQPNYYSAVLNTIILAKCIAANLWENSMFVSKQLKGIGPTFSTLLATAGKVNFMLLEESHPRDLERIMNKGPPAGNVLRKQVSLLPKYQLTMTPIDEKAVSIQLVLLNHHNLSENVDQLTAGAAHKSYVIIGDSENTLLQLTSFRDQDLIGVYDGSITYQITRKYSFEHKIYAHCISSTYAGIDAQCEYVFKDVQPQMYPPQSGFNDDVVRKPLPAKKQTTITDTFKERKRKNTDNELTQSKEKKKRESALFEKFKNLKESFGKTSKILKDDFNKSAVMSEKILEELKYLEKSDAPTVSHENVTSKQQLVPVKSYFFEKPTTYEINEDDFTNDEFMDEDKINDILTEIECEISTESSKVSDEAKLCAVNDNCITQKAYIPMPVNTSVPNRIFYPQIDNYKTMNINRKRTNKNIPKKSNYNFIDLLEKNLDLSDAEEANVQEQNSFTDTIKSHVEKYLQKTKTNVKPPSIILDLMNDEPVQSKEAEPNIIVQNSNVIDKNNYIDTFDKAIQLTSDSDKDKVTIIDKTKEPVNETLKQVTVLEHDTVTIKSVDFTTDEYPSIDDHNIQHIYEETELPEVTLLRYVNNDDNNAINNIVEQPGSKITSRHNNAKQNISLNKTKVPETELTTTITENISTENIGVKKPSIELDLKKLKSDSDKCALDKTISDKIYTSAATLCPMPILKEKQKFSEIHTQKDKEPKQSDREVTYNIYTPVAFEMQHNRNPKTIDLPNTSPALITNDKQDFLMMELCKNYLKELPPLVVNKNIKATEITNTFHNQEPSTQQNDNIKKLPLALPNSILMCPELKGTPRVTEMVLPKSKETGFIPPYKHTTISAKTGKPTCLQNYSHIKLPIALQSVMTLVQQSILEIEPPKISELHEKQGNPKIELANLDDNETTICDTGNKLIFTPERYDYFNDKKHYINNYSYTSSKTDESTQETADHVVRVIRKLKIDLDITEIIDEKNLPDTVNNKEQMNNKQEYPNVTFTKRKLACNPSIDNCNDNLIANTSNYNSTFGNNFEKCNLNTLPSYDDFTASQKSFKNQIPVDNPSRQLLKCVEDDDTNCEEKDKNNEENTNTFSKYKIEDSQEETKPNNVRSILQKYSNIMRNTTRNADLILSQAKANEKITSAEKKDKPKRPFKISDIHRLNPTPLPSVLIEKPKTVNVTDFFYSSEPNNKHEQLEQNKPLTTNICELPIPTQKESIIQVYSESEHELVENKSVLEKIDDISYPSCIEALEVKEANIDQTMFNPKTLLQCFSNDKPEEFVPPPPEFRDYLNTSLESNADITLPMDCYEPMTSEEENDASREGIQSRSIFHDHCQVELTPSKEIETWNLSQDVDNYEKYASPDKSPYSFTIMRKNMEQTKKRALKSSLQNVTLPRHRSLEQFKFNHKNKFKL